MTSFNNLFGNPLLAMGMGMLANNRGQTSGQAFGNAMGGGFQAMMQAQQAARQARLDQMQQEMWTWKLDQIEREEQRRIQQAQAQQQYRGAVSGLLDDNMSYQQFAGTVAGLPGYEQQGMKMLEQLYGPQQQTKPQVVSPGQQLVSPTGEVVYAAPERTEPDKDESFSRANTLRDEFAKQSKPYVEMRDAFAKIQASAQDPSPAGDISLIFSFMKLIDPGSVVREGEQATAANAGGVPSQIRSAYNRVLTGERLAPEIRADFLQRGGMLYQTALAGQEALENQYRGLTQRYNLNPADVVLDYRPLNLSAPAPGTAPGGGGAPKPPPGFVRD